ncbi:MAG: hypothetical protein JNM72_10445 [Deltaproteobacteria bacterium]|nr:hypothetical protein [Deltaproteobacteria bacterium]
MYYDRRVPGPLLDLLLPDAPLGWLIPWLSTGPAAAAGAHVQTRRDRQGRRHGAIQLYLGRTSPLEVRGRPNGRHSLHADVSYRTMSPRLFAGDLDASGLALLADPLRQHAERAAAETHRSFLDGEAVVHAGLMRHHGPLSPSAAPFLALDSEARMGFDSQADQVAFEATLPAVVGLPAAEAVPRKLDLVAVDHDGRLLLVEVKADPTGLTRAAWQAAVHVARFRALLAQHPAWFSEVLGDLAREKARVGLLGQAPMVDFSRLPTLTPVIAAPDPREGWSAAWRSEIGSVLQTSGGLLAGLRLWRLSPQGHVVEDTLA